MDINSDVVVVKGYRGGAFRKMAKITKQPLTLIGTNVKILRRLNWCRCTIGLDGWDKSDRNLTSLLTAINMEKSNCSKTGWIKTH